jgi:hypothetical protein
MAQARKEHQRSEQQHDEAIAPRRRSGRDSHGGGSYLPAL